MSIKEDLLDYIVEASKANVNPQNPHGYCYLEAGHVGTATELHNEELIQALVTSRAADGSFPVRPTDAAVKWAIAAKMTAEAPAVKEHPSFQHNTVAVETNIPIPDKKAFGRLPGNESKIAHYGFANMPINASFFVPQDDRKDKDGKLLPVNRTFSSVVSQANRQLHPMNFVIREWTQSDGTKGARVWRTEDMQGARPVRSRIAKKAVAAAAAEGRPLQTFPVTQQPGPFSTSPAAFPGGFAAPGNPSFGMPAAASFGNPPIGGQGGFAAPSQPGQWDAPSFGGSAPLPNFDE